MSTKLFTPHTCPTCSQTMDYAMALDKGSALIVLAIANAVRRLGRNKVHIDHEAIGQHEGGESFFAMIREGYMTPTMQHNVARPRYHGLIAFVERGSGEYLLTRKGADFLRGEPVKKVAIIDKVHGKNAGYLEEAGTVTIDELLSDKGGLWAGNLGELRQTFSTVEMTASML